MHLQIAVRWKQAASVIAALGLWGCTPDLPARMGDITLSERISQRFLVTGHGKTSDQDIYTSLVGPDAVRALEAVAPDSVGAAAVGKLEVRGELTLTASIDPFDVRHYTVDGRGELEVYNQTTDCSELIVTTHFHVGDKKTHSIEDLKSLKVILPISQSAQINPSLLFGHVKANKKECVVTPQDGANDGAPVPCNAAGVGSPFRSERFFAQVHLKELPTAGIYGIDRSRAHEIFHYAPGGPVVFGCLNFLDRAPDSPKVLDLRALSYLKSIARPGEQTAAPSDYDHWTIPDTCTDAETEQD